jgi:hypothetical protein
MYCIWEIQTNFFNQIPKPEVMKKLLLIFTLILSVSAVFAQTKRIKIINSSSCTTYLAVLLSDPAAPCVQAYSSNVFTIVSGATLDYDYTNYPGSTASSTQYFIYSKILYGPPACSTQDVAIGDPCAVPSTVGAIGQYNAPNCATMCGQANVEWFPESDPDAVTILKIY